MIINDLGTFNNFSEILSFSVLGVGFGIGIITIGYIIGLTLNFIYRLLKNKN